MIYYFYNVDMPIKNHLDWRGKPMASVIRPMTYARLFKSTSIRAGTYIFSDLERLTPTETELAAKVWSTIRNSGRQVLLLNDPIRGMRRYELLRTLYEQGINPFNVYKLTEVRMPERYPVFIRFENDHKGNRSPLLKNQDELLAAISDLEARGMNRESLIIVEYIDCADEKGIYRKYSHFYVNGVVIPRHLFQGDNWMLKVPGILDGPALAEERKFIGSNPFQEEICRIFNMARIDYGRIDFSVLKNKILVWEINTNPHITHRKDAGGVLREPVQTQFVEAFHKRLLQMNVNSAQKIPLQSWIMKLVKAVS